MKETSYLNNYIPDQDEFEYDDVEVSDDGIFSIDTVEYEKKVLKQIDKLKDPNYCSFKQYNKDSSDNKISYKISLYSTPSRGRIINALSGHEERYNVGTKNDDRYFTVKDVANGLNTPINNHPRKFFFDSPREFELLYRLKVSELLKDNWRKRQKNKN
jgi:hypothetical protein